MKKIRLHQYLSKTEIFSSKKFIYQAIKNGEISVNEKIQKNPDFQIKPSVIVKYKRRIVLVLKDKIYILLNKPIGYLSSKLTAEDKRLSKKSVFSLLKNIDPKIINTLFCVGRLDENTSGLLIITNDGNLTHKITNPKMLIKKEYLVELEKLITDKSIEELESGVQINLEENGKITKYITKPCKIKKINDQKINITIQEGKKREIRRMLETLGNKVSKLQRIAIGNIKLENFNLKEGEFKIIEKELIIKSLLF